MNLPKKSVLIPFVLLLTGLIVGGYFLVSWKSIQLRNFDEFTVWLNDEENGCIRNRNIAGASVTVKYYPALYTVLNNYKATQSISKDIRFDSVFFAQSKLRTFLITIGPDRSVNEERRATSIMQQGVSGYQELVERVMTTNFFMDQNLSMCKNGIRYAPLLCLVENLYELSDSRSFIAVFGGEDSKSGADDYIVEYDDKYFGMGKVQFRFDREAIKTADKVTVKN